MIKNDVLQIIQKQPGRTHRSGEVAKTLGANPQEVEAALADLSAEGQVIVQGKGYTAPTSPTATGILEVNPKGYAFVRLEESEDLFVPATALAGAWHGDRVLARVLPDSGRRRRGEVIKILERNQRRVVGRVSPRGQLIPDDPRLPTPLALDPAGLDLSAKGIKIAALVRFPEETGGRQVVALAHSILGASDDPASELEAIIFRYELPTEFAPAVLAEARSFAKELNESDLAGRQDFRNQNVVTIDGEDAKDFDDAIHLERIEGGFRVGVHIADVSHYVPEASALDQEAYARGTSVYLPGKVLPMLPPELSEGLCSLVPGQDRLVLSALIDFSPSGEITGYSLTPGVIRSQARLTYQQVEKFLQGEAKQVPSQLGADLRDLFELAQKLRSRRVEAGSLELLTQEVKIEPGQGGQIELIPVAEPKARSLIEELMLAANRVVAAHLSQLGVSALFRVHEDPNQERYQELLKNLDRLGYVVPERTTPSAKELQKVLHQAQGKPEAPMVSMLILRSLNLAHYAPENQGHFGLAFKSYLHFTSPIRRYPDLVVHRALSSLLAGRKPAELERDYSEIAKHSSEREQAAEAAERELTKFYQALWAKSHLGEAFPGTISGATRFGAFVTLPSGAEGLVHITALNDDHYVYLEEKMGLVGERSRKVLRLGDPLTVRIIRASPALRQIDLGLAETANSATVRKGSRRVLGPPEDRLRPERPVQVTASKLYFGEWQGSDSAAAASNPPPRRNHRRRGRR